MGLFDRFKKQPPARREEQASTMSSSGHPLLDIAAIISQKDPVVMEEMKDCLKNTLAYAEDHYDRYALRTMGEDIDLIEPRVLAWIGLVDALEDCGYVCERDWKDEKTDFVHFLKTRRGMSRLRLSLKESWLNADSDISNWIETVNARWAEKGCCVATIGIDSDSYVLFPCTLAERDHLKTLAAQIGVCIE